ncbi:N-acetylgalactosamine kinase [Dermacentor andersoni]|uniref:N-acetylgalactosamine kinase n=1 Tax=Dermacentor andersoni TaxID=34620 RepID=UPI0021550FE9|nr:N-acetylgalactosamine kinase-like [Dermacentor andersoni]
MGEPVHAAQCPPRVKLADVCDQDHRERLELIRSKYHATFGSDPEFYVRAPGRVNLIGEHIDYCGYAVLPMAVQQDILLACGRNNTTMLQLTNIDNRYPSYSAPMDGLKIDDVQPCWHHYFLCGVKGAVEDAGACELGVPLPGLDVMVHGTIPPSAGLSSSSALVCAAALATLQANKAVAVPKMKLASLCAASERYIGTQGGGMDQAIAFLAEPGTAKLIEFNPLRTTSITLPEGATFVVANSLVEMNKAATSDFNIRVVECLIAAQVIAKARGLELRKQLKLGELQSLLQVPLHEMGTLAKNILHPAVYTRDELCTLFGMDDGQFEKCFLGKNTKHLQEFKLYQRAVHVYEEASRVWQFKDVCEGSHQSLSQSEQLSKLGQLMNESHTSCRDLYECSHPDLDLLVEISLQAGALGSRLTGAGWGGCSISLVPTDKLEAFLKEVGTKFYGKFGDSVAKDTAMFVTKPGSGAAIFVP